MRKFLMAAAVLAVAACAEKAPEADVVDSVAPPATEMTPSQMVDSAGKMVDSAGAIVDSAGKMTKVDTSHAM
ncbi:MAG TPA: hypothetical protein VFN22_11500 [Gemmatimonadales bacterium]|nr:hypothetical protein [Gemmatimonadales bacterium]